MDIWQTLLYVSQLQSIYLKYKHPIQKTIEFLPHTQISILLSLQYNSNNPIKSYSLKFANTENLKNSTIQYGIIQYNITGSRQQKIKNRKMLTEKEEQRQWLKQYQVEDLSRSIIREFLIQFNLTQTLNCFDSEDRHRYKKINKSVLIKMLSMNNLVYFNKQADKPFGSLLEILVNYLRDKFRVKIELSCYNNDSDVNTKKTEISNMDYNLSEKGKKADTSFNNTGKLTNDKDKKSGNSKHESSKQKRPMTSGNRVNYRNVQNIYAQLQKQDVKQKQKIIREAQEKRKQEQFAKKRKIEQQKQRQEKRKKEQQEQKEKLRKKEEQRLKEMEKQKQRERLRLEEQNKMKAEEERRKKADEERKKQQQLEIANKRKQEAQKKKKQEQTRLKQAQQMKKRKQYEQQQQLKQQQANKLKAEQEQKKKQEQRIQKEAQNKRQQQNKRIKEQHDKNEKEQQKRRNKLVVEEQAGKQDQQILEIHKQSQNVQFKDNVRMGGMRKLIKKKSEQQSQFKLEQPIVKHEQRQIQRQRQGQNSQNNFVLNEVTSSNQTSIEKPEIEQKQTQKKEEGQKMVKMFGKKKKKEEKDQESEPKKFKFDDNFVDEPLHATAQKYTYQQLQLNKITIKNPSPPQIKYKQKQIFGTRKYQQKTISQQQAQQLKKTVFQSSPSNLPKSWHQGFILSPFPATPYGLQQIQGGPCGIIAAVQCYYLKHLLHLSQASIEELGGEVLRENCLVAAIADMLFKSRSNDKIILALPPKSFSGVKLDISSFRLITIQATTFSQAFQGVFHHKSCFIGKSNHGVAVLMYCIVMTKGVQKISEQIDMPQNPLIGNHGHCTQQLVNLFITGIASSNVFDGNHNLQSIVLKGIQDKSQFGFLTIFETNNQIQVGKNLKNPRYPFWIICKQFHYHVIFSNHYLIAENNSTEKFDIIYFDGLYNCADFIRITLEGYGYGEENNSKIKDLPLIQQVMMTKWGARKGDWNGSIKIL